MTGDAPRIRRTTLLGLLAILAFAAAVRVRLADVPLERDEGEYAYIGQLALQGVPPFVDAYTMKLPGTAYAYAAIMALGGQSARAIHLGLLLVNAATILLVFALGRRLLDERAAVIAAGFFALLSLDRGVMGVWAHATHFALLFALAGLAFLERAERQTRPSRVFLAGGLLGIAVLMKQHAGLFFVAGLLLVAYDRPRDGRRDHGALLRTILWLTLGFALPLVGLVAWVAAQGVFAQFWFWTVRYGTRYLGEAPMGDALDRLRAGLHPVVDKTFAIWILAAGGAALLHVARWPARTRVAMGGLAVASGLAVCPGLYFREHYFILALPAVALLAAIAVESMGALLLRVGRSPRLAWFATVGLAVVCAGQYLASEHRYLFSMSSEALSRNRYKANLFVDVVAIADYLRDHTQPTDRVAVLGSEPELFFYAHRRSATGHIYVYPLMEIQPYAHRMQEEMILDIEAARPAYVVSIKAYPSWLSVRDSDKTLFAWARSYTREHYEEVGRVEGDGTGKTRLTWSSVPAQPKPPEEILARVYRRRVEAAKRPSSSQTAPDGQPCDDESPAWRERRPARASKRVAVSTWAGMGTPPAGLTSRRCSSIRSAPCPQ